MKRRKVISNWVKLVVAATALWISGAAHTETLRNSDVVALLDAGLGGEAVIARIETSESDFDTDTQTVPALRAQGVPSAVIAAMVKGESASIKFDDASADPKVPHSPAFYILDELLAQPQLAKIDPIASTLAKTGGIL